MAVIKARGVGSSTVQSTRDSDNKIAREGVLEGVLAEVSSPFFSNPSFPHFGVKSIRG